jgi:hypothetical protein
VKKKTRRFEERVWQGIEPEEKGGRRAIGSAFGEWESFCLQKDGEIVRRIVCRGEWREDKSFGILSF